MSIILPAGIAGKFYSYFIEGKEDECWIWFGPSDDGRYGRFMYYRKKYPAHIISYAIYNKLKEINLLVLHRCDNGFCVNPKHLFLGTNKDNTQDMLSKSREARGIDHGLHKLVEEEVIEIRQLYKTGLFTQRELAKDFNVSQLQISNIVTRKHWVHLPA